MINERMKVKTEYISKQIINERMKVKTEYISKQINKRTNESKNRIYLNRRKKMFS